MKEQELKIINKLGLHARAAAKLVKVASGFKSEVQIIKDEQAVNAKSIMGVMMLAASCGTFVQLRIEGPDEQQAMDSVATLINARFDEEE